MSLNEIGKKTLFFGMALVIGLFIGLTILEAHSPDVVVETPKENINFEPDQEENLTDVLEKSINKIWKPGDSSSITLKLKDVKKRIVKHEWKGDPVAIFADRELYLMDSEGTLVTLIDSLKVPDLPVITCDEAIIELKNNRLVNESLDDAIDILNYTKQNATILYNYISELHLSDRIGIIAYLNTPSTVPVVLGRGGLEQKLLYLDRFVQEFGASDILKLSKYLDLRFNGQIVVKKDI